MRHLPVPNCTLERRVGTQFLAQIASFLRPESVQYRFKIGRFRGLTGRADFGVRRANSSLEVPRYPMAAISVMPVVVCRKLEEVTFDEHKKTAIYKFVNDLSVVRTFGTDRGVN